MTNEAVLDILNHLCNEARNSVHATFAVMEMLPDVAADPTLQSYLELSRLSADRLLRSIDDFRDLLLPGPGVETVEEFDVVLCLGETVELLNMACAERGSRIFLEAPSEVLPIRQDRQVTEQILTRILDTVLKLTPPFDVSISVALHADDNGIRIAITPSDSGLAVRLVDWLNTDVDRVHFRNLPDMPFPLVIMAAGRRLRLIGGSAKLVRLPGAPPAVVVFVPSLSNEVGESSEQDVEAYRLNVLVTEECDHNYAVSELMLVNENVWRAHNGQEAIDMVKKQRFDIVLMDIHLPDMDGYAAIRAIREWEIQTDNARTPIAILSSDDLETQRRSAAKSGCTGFFRKPLRRNELLRMLDHLKTGHCAGTSSE